MSAVAVVIIEPEVGCLQPTSDEELIDALASFLESMGSLPPFDLMAHHDGGHSGGKGAPSAVVEASGPVTRPDGSWAAAADYEVYQELYERCAAAHAHSVAANQR